jgi:RNA polymerase sigma-70 factor (ECF subfamily)
MTATSPAKCAQPLSPGGPPPSQRMQTIYDLHSAALLRTLLNWTYGDWQAAEDLMQETMVRAWRHLETLNADPQTLRPWLFTVARRIAIDRFRARLARPPETEPEALEEAVEPAEPFTRLLDRATVVSALRELSEVHRTALIQVYLMDRTVPEAAIALGVPEGTVKSRLHHGLRAVREVVGCVGRCPAQDACSGVCG